MFCLCPLGPPWRLPAAWWTFSCTLRVFSVLSNPLFTQSKNCYPGAALPSEWWKLAGGCTSLKLGSIIWRYVLSSFSKCPHQVRAPAAHGGNLLINEQFTDCFLFLVSFSHSLTMLLDSSPKYTNFWHPNPYTWLRCWLNPSKKTPFPFTYKHLTLRPLVNGVTRTCPTIAFL